MPSICHACGNTGIQRYEDVDRNGHLCTRSRHCPRCARRAIRHNRIRIAVALALLATSMALNWWGGLPR